MLFLIRHRADITMYSELLTTKSRGKRTDEPSSIGKIALVGDCYIEHLDSRDDYGYEFMSMKKSGGKGSGGVGMGTVITPLTERFVMSKSVSECLVLLFVIIPQFFFRIWRTMILRFVYCCFLESYHLQLEYLFLENVYLAFCLSHVKTSGGVARPKIFGGTKFFGGAKCLTLDEQQYFCLGRHFSKHKMTRYAKNLGGWPSGPPGYAYGQDHNNVQVRRFFTRLRWLEGTL